MIEHEPFEVTILRHQRDAELNRVGGRDARARSTVDLDRAGFDGAKTEDGCRISVRPLPIRPASP
jgi:hypothetical protein